jgi:hypothetical protein
MLTSGTACPGQTLKGQSPAEIQGRDLNRGTQEYFDPETGEVFDGPPANAKPCGTVVLSAANTETQRKEHRRERRLAARRRHKPLINSLRIKDLQKLLRHRDPAGTKPEALELVIQTAQHLVRLPGNARKRIADFLDENAPWLPDGERAELVDAICDQSWRRPARAAILGKRLQLTEAERSHLGITTIRSIDGLSSRKRKRERDKARQAHVRRKNGAKSHADSLSQKKPWKRLRMSRRSYYRKGFHLLVGIGNLAQKNRHQDLYPVRDEFVPRVRTATGAGQSRSTRARGSEGHR